MIRRMHFRLLSAIPLVLALGCGDSASVESIEVSSVTSRVLDMQYELHASGEVLGVGEMVLTSESRSTEWIAAADIQYLQTWTLPPEVLSGLSSGEAYDLVLSATVDGAVYGEISYRCDATASFVMPDGRQDITLYCPISIAWAAPPPEDPRRIRLVGEVTLP